MRTEFTLTETTWRAVILGVSCTVLLVTVFCLVQGITVIFMHLYYVPIVLLAYHYRKTGFWLSVLLSFVYLTLVVILVPGNPEELGGAVLRLLVFIGVAAIVTYLAERRDAGEALRQSEEKFRTIFENSPMGMTLVSPEFRFISVNPAWVAMTGYSEEELLQLTFRDITHPDHLAGDMEHIRDLIGGTIPVYITEKRYIRKDGSILWGFIRVTAIRDSQGWVRHFLAQIEDITLRKKAEAGLAKAQQQYRELFENVNIGILRSTPGVEGALIEANPAALRIFEAESREQFLAARPADLYADHGQRLKISEEIVRQGIIRSREVRYKTLKGNLIWGRISSIRKTTPDGRIFFDNTIMDISLQKEAEDALRESEAKFRTLFESADDAIFIMSSTTFLDCNQSTLRIYGCTRDQIIGHTPVEFSPERQPDGRPSSGKAQEKIAAALSGTPQSFEWVHLHADGTPFDAEVTLNRITLSPGVFLQAIVRDITGRKRAEEQREHLIEELARKNTELDRFTYTVSHDLKSPLLAISAFLDLLEQDLRAGKTGQVTHDILRVNESVEKLEQLITTLLTLSRSGRSVDNPVPVPLSGLASEASRLLEPVLRQRGVTLVIPENLPVVMGDRGRLLQVMTNLLDNAVRFMGDQNEPRVEVSVRSNAGVPVFCVLDNGMGIKQENLAKVFGLYERFNPDIPGTGIGLATVQRIIGAHGGKVWVESEGEGKGTTVCFTLPGAGDRDTA